MASRPSARQSVHPFVRSVVRLSRCPSLITPLARSFVCSLTHLFWPLAKNPDPVPEPGPGCRIFPVISNFPVQFFSRPDFFPPGQIFFPVVGVNLRSIWRFSCDSDGPVELVRFFNVDWYQNHPKTWSGSRFLITEALFSM